MWISELWHIRMKGLILVIGFVLGGSSCTIDLIDRATVQTVNGPVTLGTGDVWLSHEHILVDFIGADQIDPQSWSHDTVITAIDPYLQLLSDYQVNFFVDATPKYLGRDVQLLQKISRQTGINILTNTGLYGAVNNKYLPDYAFEQSPEELAQIWISEFVSGIDDTDIKPGFIKISVDARDTLESVDAKLVEAAALTHLQTGLTIGSHTGPAKALWPQLDILDRKGVSPKAFIWIHAQNENDHGHYINAAKKGCWISLDGLGWDIDAHIEKLEFAKKNKLLDHILISHDAGWYDPQKDRQEIRGYTNIFEILIPELSRRGFTPADLDLLLNRNPARAFLIMIRTL